MLLAPDGQWTLGRSDECDVTLLDPSASSLHAELRWTNASVEVRDRASRFGTFVASTPLGDGWSRWEQTEPLWIGDTELRWALRPVETDATVALDATLHSSVLPTPPVETAEASTGPASPVTDDLVVLTQEHSGVAARSGASLSRLQRTSLAVAALTLITLAALWGWLLVPTPPDLP